MLRYSRNLLLGLDSSDSWQISDRIGLHEDYISIIVPMI